MNYNDEWVGMPEFIQEKIKPYHHVVGVHNGGKLNIRFENESDLSRFNELSGLSIKLSTKQFTLECPVSLGDKLGQKITDKTKSAWFPFKAHRRKERHVYTGDCKALRYPVYVVSKGRHINNITSKALNRLGIKHYVVVEADEYESYKAHVSADVLVLHKKYLNEYDTCDNFGEEKSKGPGAARNFCIDHSYTNGFKRHWVLDDNFECFYYLNKNKINEVEASGTFSAAEDFVDRYSNVPVAGMNYNSFCKSTDPVPPFLLNTRIYSCLLIENASGYRWRGRYNEDTDLSLRVLKAGLCTIQFNAFLCGKVTTQRMSGGNTKEFYANEGSLPKSQMLADLHPDVARVVWKFNRWHHHVNYKKFKGNKLLKIVDTSSFKKVDNYNLKIEVRNKKENQLDKQA